MDYHQLKFQGEESMLELHFFADASGHAYGAAAYLQLKSSHKFKCSFVISKSRIAAIKQKNISQYSKNQAAATASRITVKIMEELREPIPGVFLWLVSKTELNYFRNHSQFGLYVGHCVNGILKGAQELVWRKSMR